MNPVQKLRLALRLSKSADEFEQGMKNSDGEEIAKSAIDAATALGNASPTIQKAISQERNYPMKTLTAGVQNYKTTIIGAAIAGLYALQNANNLDWKHALGAFAIAAFGVVCHDAK